MLIEEQVTANLKNGVNTCFDCLRLLAEATARLTELNLQTVRATLTHGQSNALNALSAGGTRDRAAAQATFIAQAADTGQAYTRQLFDLVSASQAGFMRIVQTQGETYHQRMQALLDDVGKYAPAASEAAMTAWNPALTASSNALAGTLETPRQPGTANAERDLETADAAAAKAVRRTLERASQSAKR